MAGLVPNAEFGMRKGVAAPFSTLVSYEITDPGSGYSSVPTLTFNDAGTGTTTGTAVIADGELVKVTFTAIETALTGAPTCTVAGPGGGGTTATVSLVDNRLSDTVDNIYAMDALEAQALLGDAALNNAILANGIRVGNISGSNENVTQSRIGGDARVPCWRSVIERRSISSSRGFWLPVRHLTMTSSRFSSKGRGVTMTPFLVMPSVVT